MAQQKINKKKTKTFLAINRKQPFCQGMNTGQLLRIHFFHVNKDSKNSYNVHHHEEYDLVFTPPKMLIRQLMAGQVATTLLLIAR